MRKKEITINKIPLQHIKFYAYNADYLRERMKDLKSEADKIFNENGFPDDFVDLGVVGYYTINENDNRDFCQVHPNEKLIISPLSSEEYNAITCITNDLSFIHAMEKLKNTDSRFEMHEK